MIFSKIQTDKIKVYDFILPISFFFGHARFDRKKCLFYCI